jgi:hypothetical protein
MGEHRKIAAALLVLAAATLTGCSSGEDTGTDAAAQCQSVDDALMAAIAEGANMTPIEPVAAAAVPVDGFTDAHPEGSYLVALEFSSADIADGGTKVGTWAVADLDAADAPPILAVDPLADLFTDWPAEVNGVAFTGEEDGVAEAAECLTDAE